MEDAARQLLRALRGGRSQVAFSRRLGYAGNPVAKWEGGHRFPTAAETLRAAAVVGIDVPAAMAAFHPEAARAAEQPGDGRWLSALMGDTSRRDLARRAGLSVQAVGRILRGDAQPRLPAWLALVQAATGRVVELVGQLVDVTAVPCLAEQAALLQQVRHLAFAEPWIPGVLAVLEAQGQRADPDPGTVARALGVPDEVAQELLARLVASGALAWLTSDAPAVDMAPTAEEHQRLRAHWARVASERVLAASGDDLFSYNVFAVSREDLSRIRELQRAFFREVRGIVADSRPEVAAFLTVFTGTLE